MKATDLKLNENNYNLLLDIFDKDESGKIEYEEFLWFVYPEIDENLTRMKLLRCLSLFDKQKVNVDQLFRDNDSKNDGYITKDMSRLIFKDLVCFLACFAFYWNHCDECIRRVCR